MQKKYVPFVAFLLAAGASNAQTPVFHEGFDAEQTKTNTDVAWYEYINHLSNSEASDEWGIGDDSYAGDGALKINNVYPDGEEDLAQHDQFWQRAVKFRNLPLQEGKSYRLTWRLKGDNTWNNGTEDKKSRMFVSLMQGGENADIPLLDAKGNEFKYEVSYFNPSDYETYTRMFHFASEQLQKDTYTKNHPDKDPLADTFFATFNVINPGEYWLDEVDLVESPIAGVGFEWNVIRVDFGFGTNIKDLVKASPISGRVIMPADCAKVTVDGEEIDVESVELHSDGYMYIYPVEDIDDGAEEVRISFNNPEDEAHQVKYAGDLAPEGAVPSFENEAAGYHEGLGSEVSFDYLEPAATNITPEDGAFGLENVTEVKFTFDKKVSTKAKMTCALDDGEKLVLKNQDEEFTNTLVFTRQGGKPFDNALYTVSLDGVTSEKNTTAMKPFTTTFEVGKIQIATTEYTQVGSCFFPDAEPNSIPAGWNVMSDGEERPGGSDGYGSAGRVFETKAPQGKGIYTRANGGEGSVTGPAVDMPAGDIEIQNYLAYWSNAADIKVDVCAENGDVVASQTVSPVVAGEANRNNDGFSFEKIAVKFNNATAGKYYVKYTLLTEGFNGMFVGGYDVYTYKMSAGESTEAQVVYEDKTFGGANSVSAEDNCAPKAGSGWSLYQNGEKREPGGNFNYNGQRVFNLSLENLTCAYYTNGNWPNSYMIYGANEGDDEPKLHLESGRYQFTYYASNWKENSANAGKDHIVYFELDNLEDGAKVYEREDKITESDMDGKRDAKVAPKMIQFVVKITEEGDYTLKVGGTTEQMIGNFKIEKLGSQTAYYLGLVNSARELAEAELLTATPELYDGTAKNALKEAIEKYKDPTVLHSPSEVQAAKAELEAATKNMATRRDYADRFDTAKQKALDALTNVENTKYVKLDAYKQLNAVLEANLAYEVTDLEDEDLINAVQVLENNSTYLANMTADGKGISLLTKQIVELAAMLVEMEPEKDGTYDVIAAGNALTDDQNLVKALKLQLTKALYDRIASDDTFFVRDEEEGEDEDGNTYKIHDLSCYIQNANLYVTEKNVNRQLTSAENVPGWTFDKIDGLSVEWGWVGYTCNDYNPVVNQFLLNGWYGNNDISQTVAMLPAGKYIYGVGTQDRGFQDTSDDKIKALDELQHWTVAGNINGEEGKEGEIFSYAWYQLDGKEKEVKPFDISNQGQWYGLTETKFGPFDIQGGKDNMGQITIGAHPISYQSSASVDNFRLYMMGKADGFDYAAAAKKLAEEIQTSIADNAAPEGEPINVNYYNAAGVKVAEPEGVTIKVETYANGYVKVSKFLAK